jgi:fructose-1,6-bisphosphatase I
VADVHRFLLEGGIYLYPGDDGRTGKGGGKLRLLYECHPLALVVEQAGGRATNGSEPILDVVPDSLHERTPLAIGSRTEVELFEQYARRA